MIAFEYMRPFSQRIKVIKQKKIPTEGKRRIEERLDVFNIL
jgi:hypothetical protein